MILNWFKHRRRAKILATPFPDAWNNFIHDNVVHDRHLTHEFAHQLDMINGRITDGTPPLKSKNQHDRWVSVLGPEFDNLVEKCRRGNRGLLDCYGATNPAEFFAVLTETYFESPVALRQYHGEIYNVLHDYYGLDTAEWPEDF